MKLKLEKKNKSDQESGLEIFINLELDRVEIEEIEVLFHIEH